MWSLPRHTALSKQEVHSIEFHSSEKDPAEHSTQVLSRIYSPGLQSRKLKLMVLLLILDPKALMILELLMAFELALNCTFEDPGEEMAIKLSKVATPLFTCSEFVPTTGGVEELTGVIVIWLTLF